MSLILKRSRTRGRIAALMTGALLLSTAVSCDMINENLDPCAPNANCFTKITFKYDYNMKNTDWFNDHVGSVYLYIFDDKGIFLHKDSLFRVNMGNKIDFSFEYDTTLLKSGHSYQMVAMAIGNREGFAASLTTPSFTLVGEPMKEGESTIEQYRVRLDRKHPDGTSGVGEFEYKNIYGDTETMIDTIWSTKPDEVQYVNIPSITYVPSVEKREDFRQNVEIPMMRITNAITVNLVNSSFTHDTDPEDYKMIIHFPEGNGTIDFTGTVYPFEPLDYRTLRKNLITYIPGNIREPSNPDEVRGGTRAEQSQYAVQGIFGVSRLMTRDESSLQIYDSKNGQLLHEIQNFSAFLAQAFNIENEEEAQDYLNREYNFEVTLGVVESQIAWIDVYLEVAGWYVRCPIIGL